MLNVRPSPRSLEPVRLFYSYVAADEAWALELEKHLAPLQRQGLLQWGRRCLSSAGEPWTETQRSQLEQAEVVVLLLSADSLAALHAERELDPALERHRSQRARVIPILLRAVDWSAAPFADIPVLPRDQRPLTSWSDRGAAWAEVIAEIKRTAEALRGDGLWANSGASAATEAPHGVVYKAVRTATAGVALVGLLVGVERYHGVRRSHPERAGVEIQAQALSLAQVEEQFKCPRDRSCRLEVRSQGASDPEQQLTLHLIDVKTATPVVQLFTTLRQVRAWRSEARLSPLMSELVLAVAGEPGQAPAVDRQR